MTEEKKVKRTRRPLPDGVAGRLIGMGIEIEVPGALLEMARLVGAYGDGGVKRRLKQIIDASFEHAAETAAEQVQREIDKRDVAAFEEMRARLTSRGLIGSPVPTHGVDDVHGGESDA